MSVLHQSMCTSKVGLANLRHVFAKYKDEVRCDMSDFHHDIETSYKLKTQVKRAYRFVF